MTKAEKFNKSKRLSSILAQIKLLEAEKSQLSAELAAYVAETGDDKFLWSECGVRLTYVKGCAPVLKVNEKLFFEAAIGYMSPEDYEKCKKQSMKMTSGRKPSFR